MFQSKTNDLQVCHLIMIITIKPADMRNVGWHRQVDNSMNITVNVNKMILQFLLMNQLVLVLAATSEQMFRRFLFLIVTNEYMRKKNSLSFIILHSIRFSSNCFDVSVESLYD